MKIILTGSTGFIGSEVLRQSLARPDITSIIVLSRRSLAPSPETNDPKLKVLVMNDFGTYSESDLKELGDADCCVWAMGTTVGDPVLELDYPLAFVQAMSRNFGARSKPFSYVHLGGKYISQNQTDPLWFMQAGRRVKGLAAEKLLGFADEPLVKGNWQTTIFKPSAVTKNTGWGLMEALAPIVGTHHSVKVGELAASMTEVALQGTERRVWDNQEIVLKGREVLERAA